MSESELVSYLDERRDEREVLRQQLQQLSAERERYLRSKLGVAVRTDSGIGAAMLKAIREQAREKGFTRADAE